MRSHGYEAVSSASVEEAETHLGEIDIAVLDYHLGAGKFGTEVAQSLRDKRPEVPIIILSATLERKFGGVEDMHLLKGYSSVDDLLGALRSFEAKRRGKPVVVDARDFFYSRIAMAMGDDIVLEILDRDGVWQYVNDYFARMYEKKRSWFAGKNRFEEFPELSERVERHHPHRGRHAGNLRGPQLPLPASSAQKEEPLELEHPGLPPQAPRQPQRRSAGRTGD